MSRIAVSTSAFQDAMRTLGAAMYNVANQAIGSAVKAAEASARGTNLFEDQSGKTRASIKGSHGGGRGRLIAGGMSKFLQSGTKAHVIRPKRGRFLRFIAGQRVVFAKSVNHPGTAERPFMTIARDAGEQALAYAADLYLSHAISRI